jgi:hypothetical protein
MRPCPSCGKEIKDIAVLCKWCLVEVGPLGAEGQRPRGKWYCPTCGYVGGRASYTKGSLGMAVLLYLLMILPGVLYSVWRLTSKYEGCPKCQAPQMIPADSPKATAALLASPPKPL